MKSFTSMKHNFAVAESWCALLPQHTCPRSIFLTLFHNEVVCNVIKDQLLRSRAWKCKTIFAAIDTEIYGWHWCVCYAWSAVNSERNETRFYVCVTSKVLCKLRLNIAALYITLHYITAVGRNRCFYDNLRLAYSIFIYSLGIHYYNY